MASRGDNRVQQSGVDNAAARRKPARDAQLADLAGPATRTRRGNSQRTSGRSAPFNCGQIIRSPQLLAAARRVGNGVAAIGRGRRSRGGVGHFEGQQGAVGCEFAR